MCQRVLPNLKPFSNSRSLRQRGKDHLIRLLLDPAATNNFITKDLVKRLQLKTHENSFDISGFNNNTSTLTSCTTAHISSRNSNYSFDLPCIIITEKYIRHFRIK